MLPLPNGLGPKPSMARTGLAVYDVLELWVQRRLHNRANQEWGRT
jgi:hypothetical protein